MGYEQQHEGPHVYPPAGTEDPEQRLNRGATPVKQKLPNPHQAYQKAIWAQALQAAGGVKKPRKTINGPYLWPGEKKK